MKIFKINLEDKEDNSPKVAGQVENALMHLLLSFLCVFIALTDHFCKNRLPYHTAISIFKKVTCNSEQQKPRSVLIHAHANPSIHLADCQVTFDSDLQIQVLDATLRGEKKVSDFRGNCTNAYD